MAQFAIMTQTGRNKEAAALAGGTALTITEIAWGDGDRIPGGNETSLQNEQGRKAVQGEGTVDGALNTAFFEILLDVEEGPYVVREAGLFDDDGDMIAVAHYDPVVNKPKDTVSALLRVHVLFSDLENLVLRVQGTDAYVPRERSITAGNGLSGGGDLAEDRTLAVNFATKAEVLAGTRYNVAVSPIMLKERVGSIGGVGLLVPNADLDALRVTSTHVIVPGDTGNPLPSHYGMLMHTEGPEQRGWQMAQMSNNRTYTRTRYKTSQSWSDWEQLWGSSDAQTLFQSNGYRIAPDGLIIQWGSGAINNGGPGSGAFPIAFPNACYQVLGTDRGSGRHIIAMDGNKTNWTCWSALAGGGFASSTFFRYIATGH